MTSIRELVRTLATTGDEIYCKVCTVDAVDEEARTVDCSPLDESAPLLGVNLSANQQSEDGVVAFPAVGSYVVAAFLSPATAVVVLTEKIDKIALVIGDTAAEITDGKVSLEVGEATVEIEGGKLTINGGDLGGLVKIGELRQSLDSIKTYCETLKTAVSAGIKAVGMGTAANGPTAATGFDSAMASTKIKIESMENDKIKH